MPTNTVDGRPGRLDWTIHPGKSASLTLDHATADELVGRTFTASFGCADPEAATPVYLFTISASVVSDDIVIALTGVQTALLAAGSLWWKLVETTGGGSSPIIVGKTTANVFGTGSANSTATVPLTSTTVQVTAATPGPPGPQGEPGEGGGGGAPTDATYLVTTAHDDLSGEVVVGATPGGELGGTWASPTVDAVHSGSSHAQVQEAAEATAVQRANHTGSQAISTVTNLQASLDAKADLVGGTVPSEQLPSFVDDVIEAANFAALPGTGTTGKIYVTLDDNKTYRWSGSAYVEISSSLALGETSGTAYRGDRGKTAYDHSQLTSGNPHSVTKSDVGLGNVDNTSDANKPVSTAAQTALDLKAPLANPTFTGNVVVPDADAATEALNRQTGDARYAPLRLTVEDETTTARTLALTDEHKLIRCTNAAATTVTVPLEATVAFAVGTQINLAQSGAGQVTVAATGGVTVNGTPTLKTRAQHSTVTLIKTGADRWLAVGDLAAS